MEPQIIASDYIKPAHGFAPGSTTLMRYPLVFHSTKNFGLYAALGIGCSGHDWW